MKDKITLGCLLFLTDENRSRRYDIVQQSIFSLNFFQKQENVDLLIINNGNKDKDDISSFISEDCQLVTKNKIINLNKNYFDIASHMCSYWHALENGNKYFAYTYDDFVFTDDKWIDEAIEFMNLRQDISCIRIPSYIHNDAMYNTKYTSKDQNPDAVRHETGAGNKQLDNQFSWLIGTHNFYKSNWLPNSRPMLWRTSEFGHMINSFKTLPVMQSFEALMYEYANINYINWTSGFIDKGVCYTFPVKTSERTLVSNHYRDVSIDVLEFRKAYDDASNT